MPNIKSAKKRVKVIAKKTLKNKMVKTALKTTIKKFETAAADNNDKKVLAEAYKNAIIKVDQAAAKGILHKNNAARKKSQYTKKLNALNNITA